MKEITTYKYKGLEYRTEEEAIRNWIKDTENSEFGNMYSVFKLRDGKAVSTYSLKIIDIDELQKIRNVMNDCMVYYKKCNQIYNYKNMSKIKFDNVKHIVLSNLRGINGNVCGFYRINYIDDKLIRIS